VFFCREDNVYNFLKKIQHLSFLESWIDECNWLGGLTRLYLREYFKKYNWACTDFGKEKNLKDEPIGEQKMWELVDLLLVKTELVGKFPLPLLLFQFIFSSHN